MEISLEQNILGANDKISDELKEYFSKENILCLNLMSSPGSGKTSLLVKTLSVLSKEFSMAVVEGDLQTDNDARRIAETGVQVVQINTNGGCHLDAKMVKDSLKSLNMNGVEILFVENVGNLVCPAEFSVGEDHKITLLSVAEGDDKPQKYPTMFHSSAVMLLNKVDLLPYVDFDTIKAREHASALNKNIIVFPVSCRTEEGLEAWYDWLRAEVAKKKSAIAFENAE